MRLIAAIRFGGGGGDEPTLWLTELSESLRKVEFNNHT